MLYWHVHVKNNPIMSQSNASTQQSNASGQQSNATGQQSNTSGQQPSHLSSGQNNASINGESPDSFSQFIRADEKDREGWEETFNNRSS